MYINQLSNTILLLQEYFVGISIYAKPLVVEKKYLEYWLLSKITMNKQNSNSSIYFYFMSVLAGVLFGAFLLPKL